MFLFSELLRGTQIRNDLNANFESVFSMLMGLQLSTNDTKALYDDIKKQYLLGNDYINIYDPKSIQGLINVNIFLNRLYKLILEEYEEILINMF